MKTWLLRASTSCIILAAFVSASRAADTNPPPRLTFELRDGSRVVGDGVDKTFKFRSALLGDLKLPVNSIRSVDCVSTNAAKLTTTNGDTLTVAFVDSVLAVKTGFGKVELAVNSIRKLTVSAGRSPGAHPPGLVALWSGENDGKDAVGGHDAIVSSGVTFSPAKLGLGFNFNGLPNSVIVPNAPELNFADNQNFSVVAWIQPLSSMTTYGVMTIVDKRFERSGNESSGFEFSLVNGRIHSRTQRNEFGPAGPDLRDGQFHLVALTIQRDSPEGGHLYVDGRSVLTFDTTALVGDLSNDQPLHIGNHCDSGLNCFFKGIINQIALYNRALSIDEIRGDFEAGNKN